MEARLMTATGTAALMPADAPTCERNGCTFNGGNYYFVNGERVCGPCLDREDDLNMPYLTSEYAWQILKEKASRE